MHIHERENWTNFRWDDSKIALLIEEASRKQGLLFGRLCGLSFDNKLKAMAENMTKNVVFSSEIEGIKLNVDEVRSSIAKKLGIENVKYTAPSHYVDSVVAVMLDAVAHYDQPLTKDKLCAWQNAFFPSGYSEGSQIEVGQYRTHEEHIVSGMLGRERVHYIAPSPDRIEDEMAHFLYWFNQARSLSTIIASAIAHFWFVSILSKTATVESPVFFQTYSWLVATRVSYASTTSPRKSTMTKSTIMKSWRKSKKATVTSRNGLFGTLTRS